MNQASDMIHFLLPAAAGVIAFAVGFYLARKRKSAIEPALPLSRPLAEEADEPTAPITPVIEIGRSPHDRHRDLAVGNALVRNIEMLEFILKSGDRQGKEEILRQIGLLKTDFDSLLGNCSFRPFDYAPGTIVEAGMRNRIQIVEGRAGEGRTKIVKTLRCGFFYDPGSGEDQVVIRKAEVKIG